jgi:hypothetical protein
VQKRNRPGRGAQSAAIMAIMRSTHSNARRSFPSLTQSLPAARRTWPDGGRGAPSARSRPRFFPLPAPVLKVRTARAVGVVSKPQHRRLAASLALSHARADGRDNLCEARPFDFTLAAARRRPDPVLRARRTTARAPGACPLYSSTPRGARARPDNLQRAASPRDRRRTSHR